MAGKHVTPTTSEKSFSCPHCGAYAHQYWYKTCATSIRDGGLPARYHADNAELVRSDGGVPPEVKESLAEFFERAARGEVFFEGKEQSQYAAEIVNVSASLCYSCQKIAVWIHNRLAYPPVREGDEPNADLPGNVLADYEEARSIVSLSPRGAAALLRLCIQKLCKYLGEPGTNLNDDIASLVRNGLDVRVQQALDIVRVIGNESVHPGTLDLKDDAGTATELFRLVNLIAESMISQPKRINAMYERLPEPKRKAIEARDKGGRSGG